MENLNWNNINFWKQFKIKSEHNMIRYINFIKSIQNKGKRNLNYCERHHIVPKSFIENNVTIELTAKEHYLVHWILARALGGKMIFAFHKMCYSSHKKNRYKVTSKTYEELRIMNSNELSKMLKGKKLSEEHKRKLSECAKNRKLSEETKRKIGEAGKGKRRSEETKKKMSDAYKRRSSKMSDSPNFAKAMSKMNSNRKIINKDGIERHIKSEDLQKFLNNGWTLGALKSPASGTVMINNGEINKRIKPEDLQHYLNIGWIKGSKSKGKIKFSEEHRRNLGIAKRNYLNNNPDAKRKQAEMLNKSRFNKIKKEEMK